MMPPEKRKVQIPISDEVLLPSSYDERGEVKEEDMLLASDPYSQAFDGLEMN